MELKVPVRKDAPGPSRRSLLLSAFRADPEKTLDSFLELQHAYGDIVRLPFPGATFYMLMHPDYVEHVLIHKYRNYAKDRVLRAHRAVFGNGLLTNEGETWLQMRRLLQPAFHRQQVEEYGKIMVDLTQQALEGWRVGEARDVQAEMGKLTLDIVVRALFGVDGGEVVYRTAAALNAVMDHVSAQFVFPAPLPDWLPTRVNRDYRKAVKTLDAIVWDIVHRRRLKFEPGEDLLGTLLQVRDEADRGLTDRQLRDELVTMILAGHETTAQALTFTFYLLARHPNVERKLRDEIGAVLGGRPIQAADLPGLPYLEAVVQESLRLYPPAASMGRQVIEDDEIGGFSIPAGSEVLISQWAIHHDARFFPDPMTFSPERWLDGLEDRLPRFAYFPFGGGPRQCIGAGFAMQEARMILASVLQKYSLETADERPLVLKPSLTIRAKGGIRMRIGEAYFSSGIMPRPLQT